MFGGRWGNARVLPMFARVSRRGVLFGEGGEGSLRDGVTDCGREPGWCSCGSGLGEGVC